MNKNEYIVQFKRVFEKYKVKKDDKKPDFEIKHSRTGDVIPNFDQSLRGFGSSERKTEYDEERSNSENLFLGPEVENRMEMLSKHSSQKRYSIASDEQN